MVVRLLDHSRAANGEARTIDRKVRHIVAHSRYDDKTFNNDIALLELDKAVPMEGLLRPVCLPITGTRSVSPAQNLNVSTAYTLTCGFM
jgi:secreted trypsin-like serine protease